MSAEPTAVQQLAVHTIGGAVQAAQALLVLVPRDSPLVVEAQVENKDIGFLKVGQPVRVKIDAFPFTDYGVIDGTLVGLSNDAIQDDKPAPASAGGAERSRPHLYYLARISLKQRSIRACAGLGRRQASQCPRHIPLQPGMSVEAEILTGSRPIINYLLSPILKGIDEAGRER